MKLKVLILMGFVTLGGCDAYKKVRQIFHPGERDPNFGYAGVKVTVDPSEGISIYLNGERVATESPFVAENLKAGLYNLEVRGMGHHSVVVPIELKNNETLEVPVSLRKRAPSKTKTLPSQGGQAPPAPPDAPQAKGPKPKTVTPVALIAISEPTVPLVHNGEPLSGKTLTLVREQGELIVGVMRLAYFIRGDGTVAFVIPEDKASWTRNKKQVPTGATVYLSRSPLQLTRESQDGTMQRVVLKKN